jgi:pantoate kinase
MKTKFEVKKTASSRLLTAGAFAPGHITGFFEIDDTDPDPLGRGSRGAGISLAAGVVTVVRRERSVSRNLSINLNEHINSEAPVSRRVAELFFEAAGEEDGNLVIVHRIAVPQGAGFGSSGAGALSLALALNAACGEPLSATAAGQIAHRAEIDCRTGLGTVLACTVSGLEIRTRAGAPGRGEALSFALAEDLVAYCLVFGPLSTAAALSDPETRRRINAAGAASGRRLLSEPTARRFMELSREFSEKTGLVTDRLRRLLDELDRQGIVAAMTMFGEAVFTLIEESQKPLLDGITRNALAIGASAFESKIAPEGGKVICDA